MAGADEIFLGLVEAEKWRQTKCEYACLPPLVNDSEIPMD